MTNTYTAQWFDLFLRPISPEQTTREVAFLQRVLPVRRFPIIIDVCCGTGRHAHQLASLGYTVLGVDRDAQAIAEARAQALPQESYIQHDMRELAQFELHANAVVCLWQSFGFFDTVTNRAVLASLADMLPEAGRCVLDIYHPGFFEATQGERSISVAGRTLSERKQVRDGRLLVELADADGKPIDSFDWELFTPETFAAMARDAGLALVLACTGFDEQQAPTAAAPRVQYVFAKAASEHV